MTFEIIQGRHFGPVHFHPLFQSDLLETMLYVETEVYLLFNAVFIFHLFLEIPGKVLGICRHLCELVKEWFDSPPNIPRDQDSSPNANDATNLPI